MSKFVMELTDDKFKKEVENAKTPVMVDFWASWCGPCKMMAPIVEELAGKYEGKLKAAKINIDDNQAVATQMGVMSIPTFIFFKDGKETKRFSGALSKNELDGRIKDIVGA